MANVKKRTGKWEVEYEFAFRTPYLYLETLKFRRVFRWWDPRTWSRRWITVTSK